MYFKPVKKVPKKIASGKSNYGGNQKLIESFLESGHKYGVVENYSNATSWSCVSSLNKTARVNKYMIKAFSYNGVVYIVRANSEEK